MSKIQKYKIQKFGFDYGYPSKPLLVEKRYILTTKQIVWAISLLALFIIGILIDGSLNGFPVQII